MNRMLVAGGLLLAFVLSGCSPISVKTDYDHEANFQAYRTFRWMPYPKNAKRKTVARNSLLDVRIRRAVENELRAHGYEIRKRGKVDALLAYHVAVRKRVEVDPYGYGYWRRYPAVYRYKEGTIIIDIVDPERKQLVWRGAAAGVAGRPENNAEQVTKAIAKIFEKYPPS